MTNPQAIQHPSGFPQRIGKIFPPAIRRTFHLGRSILHSERMEANAFFVWTTTVINVGAGFLFWNLAARFYLTEEVGIATSVVSLMMLLSGITSLGIGAGLVRFLSTANDPVSMINVALTFTTLTSTVFGLICVFGISIWSPELTILQEPWFCLIFLLLLVSTTHFLLLQMVFLSRMRSSAMLWMSILMNLVRLGLLFSLHVAKAQGIVIALAIATFVSNLLALLLIRRLLPRYRPGFLLSRPILRSIIPYSLASGISDFLSRVPVMLAPLLAMHYLGAPESARIYVAWMIGSVIISPSNSLAQSAFSTASSEPDRLRTILRQSGVYSLLITVILSITVFLLADALLGLFGVDYRIAVPALEWICVAAPLYAINSLFTTAFRVLNKLWIMILINAMVIGIFVAPQPILLGKTGLSVTGSAWLVAQMAVFFVGFAAYLRTKPTDPAAAASP